MSDERKQSRGAESRKTGVAGGRKSGGAESRKTGGAESRKTSGGERQQAGDGERRLTAGERNAQLRQERKAEKRRQAASEAPGNRRGTGRAASGDAPGRSRRVSSTEAGDASARPRRASASGAGDAPVRAGRAGDAPDRSRKAVETGAAPVKPREARKASDAPVKVTMRGEAAPPKIRKPRHTAAQRAERSEEPRAAAPRGESAGGGRTGERKVHRHKAAARQEAGGDVYRAGFACFVGRPNAGKSTLTNAIVGQKIAITSNKPQTTRHVIRGVLHRDDAQLVLVDTPGLHRPKTLLGERLNDLVRETWSEVDVIGVCFPADEPVGAGDRFISSEIAELKAKVIAVVTKVDLVDPATLAERLLAVSKLYDFAEIVPVSAVSGHQVETLVDVIVKHLPESPPLYPDDVLTEEPEQVLIGELIREAALEGVRDELPHSIAVLVEEMIPDGKLTKIYANVYVERDSQKSIVIGTKGSRLKDVGITARAEIEALLGRKVYLDLHVRVAKEWQRDPKQLRRLGF